MVLGVCAGHLVTGFLQLFCAFFLLSFSPRPPICHFLLLNLLDFYDSSIIVTVTVHPVKSGSILGT